MQEKRLEPAARAARVPQKTLILWLLFLGVVLSFCGNIYQDLRAEALARNIALKIEEGLQYPGQIRVTVIRETRCVEVAK